MKKYSFVVQLLDGTKEERIMLAASKQDIIHFYQTCSNCRLLNSTIRRID